MDGDAAGQGSPLGRVLGDLACPACSSPLAADGGALRCTSGHSFDIARQGYVSLLGGNTHAGTADTAEMVAARAEFLGRGHYEPIAEAVSGLVPADDAGLCLDLAGGTGYYLAHFLDRHPRFRGLCLDLSKFALRRAARAHARAGAAAADIWQPLPVRSGSASCVLGVFGPRNIPEVRRLLAPGGLFVVVSPTPRHLHQLVGGLGLIGVDARKPERLAAQMASLRQVRHLEVEYDVMMPRADLLADALMGPSARHVEAATLAERAAALPDPYSVTVSVDVTAYTARGLRGMTAYVA